MRINKNIKLILFYSLMTGISGGLLSVIYNLFLKHNNIDENQIGLILSSSAFGLIMGTLPSIYFAKRFSVRTILSLQILFIAVSLIFRAWTLNIHLIIFLSVLAGFFNAFQATIIFPFLKECSQQSKIDTSSTFALFDSIAMGSGLIGNLIGGYSVFYLSKYIDLNLSYNVTLSIAAILIGLAIFPVFSIKSDKIETHPSTVNPIAFLTFIKSKLIIKILIPDLLIGAGAGFTIPFLNLFLKTKFSFSEQIIGTIFSITSVGTFISVYTSSRIAKKFSLVKTVFYSELLSIPFMLALAFFDHCSITFVAIAICMRGALINLGGPLLRSFTIELVPKSDHHALVAFKAFAWNIMWMISSLASGFIIHRFGYNATLYITSALYFLAACFFYYNFRSYKDPQIKEKEREAIDSCDTKTADFPNS